MSPHEDTLVFLGPTLPHDEAARLVDATFLPPARMGDIYRVLPRAPRRIVLIDGVFHNVPSVWQRELLTAIDLGVAVYGASSMGALRAAELHRYGMRGHGQIFEWLRDGIIEGDDEVALVHGAADDGFRPLSEPLVNVRATLRAAQACGELDADRAARWLALAATIPYAERTWAAVITLGGSRDPAGGADRLASFIRSHRVDQKRLDAVALLQHVAAQAVPGGNVSTTSGPPSVWLRERFMALRFGAPGRTVEAARLYAAATEQRARLARWLHKRWFLCARVAPCPTAALQAFIRDWQVQWAIRPSAAWFAENALVEAEYHAWLRDEASIHHATVGQSDGRVDIPVSLPIGVAEALDGSESGGAAAQAQCAMLLAWADANGVHGPGGADDAAQRVATMLERGPAWFGAGYAFREAVEVLKVLQMTGLAARLADTLA